MEIAIVVAIIVVVVVVVAVFRYTVGARHVTDLMKAAQEGQTEAIRELTSVGTDIEARDSKGWTALIWAALEGQTEAIRELLKAGANIEARDNLDSTVLMVAAYLGQSEAIRELLKAGANIEARNKYGDTAFDFWQRRQRNHSDFQEIAELLKGTLMPEYIVDKLMSAAYSSDRIEAIRELVKARADIEARDNVFGWTGLMWAAHDGHTEAIRELLKAGANIEARDKELGMTALMVVALNGHTEAIRELLKAGADTEARNKNGLTAFDLWQSKKTNPDFHEIAELLKP